MLKPIRTILILAFISTPVFISSSFAAGMGGGHTPPCGGVWGPPCAIPLDNGVMALLVIGAAYGSLKIYQSLKKNPA